MTLSQTSGYGQTLNPAAFAAGRPGSSPERRTGGSRAGAAAVYGEVQEVGRAPASRACNIVECGTCSSI